MNTKFTLSVYNTVSGLVELVPVTEAVYHEFRRTEWRIANSDRSFRKHQTPFSALIGDDHENFTEFIDEISDPLAQTIDKIEREQLRHALRELAPDESCLLFEIFVEQRREREIAREMGVPHTTVHSKKMAIIAKLKKFL